MPEILVLGATGLVGRRLTLTLLEQGFQVRCAVRNPAKARRKLPAACEIVRGDIADLDSMREAHRSVKAVYICVHTLSAQPQSSGGENFVDIELRGLANILTACRTHEVDRILFVTFLGAAPDAITSWARGRWQAEQLLLNSGLNVTVLRPGQIVGKGGHGFDMMIAQAKRRIAIVLGSGQHKMQNIAVDDLVYYLIAALDEPRTFGHVFDVGSESAFSSDQMIDLAARVLGRPGPYKIHLPACLLLPLAGLVERLMGLPQGAFRDLLQGMESDLIGDPGPIRAILPHTLLDYPQAIQKALRACRKITKTFGPTIHPP